MPRIVRTPQIQTRLSRADNERLDRLCVTEKKTKAEVLRDAVRWYLDNQDQLQDDARTDRFVAASAKNTDRICKMLNRALIEIGTLYVIQHDLIGNNELFQSFVNTARDRLKKRLAERDDQLSEQLSKFVQE